MSATAEKSLTTEMSERFKSVLSIKPFVTAGENMGLEKYRLVIHPGTKQIESLAAIVENNQVRYLTGLNEFAPEIRNIKDKTEREARIKDIRETVIYLEEHLASNQIKIDDEEFWNKVKVVRPDNADFWENVTLTLTNEPTFIRPGEDPMDLIKYYGLQAGGFNLVAKSYDDAISSPQPPKWYLDNRSETSRTIVESKRMKNNALGELENLYKKGGNKFMWVAKITDPEGGHQYKYSTPPDVLYDNMDEFLNGRGGETNTTLAAEIFIENCAFGSDKLKMKALVKDAAFYKIIQVKGDGHIYHMATNTMLGANLAEVVMYMLNPINENLMTDFMSEVEGYWKD